MWVTSFSDGYAIPMFVALPVWFLSIPCGQQCPPHCLVVSGTCSSNSSPASRVHVIVPECPSLRLQMLFLHGWTVFLLKV
jgi:hypothetical protein